MPPTSLPSCAPSGGESADHWMPGPRSNGSGARAPRRSRPASSTWPGSWRCWSPTGDSTGCTARASSRRCCSEQATRWFVAACSRPCCRGSSQSRGSCDSARGSRTVRGRSSPTPSSRRSSSWKTGQASRAPMPGRTCSERFAVACDARCWRTRLVDPSSTQLASGRRRAATSTPRTSGADSRSRLPRE
jgi:hypothetical protein